MVREGAANNLGNCEPASRPTRGSTEPTYSASIRNADFRHEWFGFPADLEAEGDLRRLVDVFDPSELGVLARSALRPDFVMSTRATSRVQEARTPIVTDVERC